MNNYTLIPIKDYHVIVSDELPRSIADASFNIKQMRSGHFGGEDLEFNRRVIASTNSDYLPNIDVSIIADKIGGVDVDKLFKKYLNERYKTMGNPQYFDERECKRVFFDTFNKAKETFKYTEEDLRKAFKAGKEYQMGEYSEYHGGKEHNYPDIEQYIQSLQNKQYKVELEMEYETKLTTNGTLYLDNPRIKITNNSVKIKRII